ncbi:transcriptional regulator, LysR family [Aquitalea magnusonii]|uniref:Transcriptional regulator, LysR family n=1 Tax=Aquitalea magnusonii TaxID=332411 RepID=A0A3G9GGR0_9NEIS|nr:LysR family transcriptional regulator [Aquitalea magnusonii]BBF85809.1 transcriptional regulator, LysR family [Aquitalea magnusonii]
MDDDKDASGALRTALPLQAGTGERIELMLTFLRIVEAGSLSAAAVQLGTTQPTVSRRLQMLERSLGLRLLQRSTHAMRLTQDGERCYERAKELLAGWARFESELKGAREEPEGVLRVIVPHAFGQERLIGPLARYLQQHAGMAVEWLLHDDRAIQDYIAAGIDCAIQVGEVRDPGLVAVPLAQVPRIVVAAPSLLNGQPIPQDASELAALPWLALRTFYRNEVRLTHCETGKSKHIQIRPRFSTDSLYALRSAALQGVGVGIGSSWVMDTYLAQGQLIQLAPKWQAAALPVSLVYPYARFYPARLRRFIDLIRAEAPTIFAAQQHDPAMAPAAMPNHGVGR